MEVKKNQTTRGILHAAVGQEKFTLTRFEPSEPLKPFVEHYWALRFDLQDEPPYTQTVLSFPNVNLAFEQDEWGRRALLYGIPKHPFKRELNGVGRVLGVKFIAGGFYPFWQKNVSELTGKTITASELFGLDLDDEAHNLLDAADDVTMAKLAENILLRQLPARDEQGEHAAQIVREIMNDRSIIKVEQISERYHISIRQLQRMFNKYIGVSPKWVIKRYRVQEAAQRLEQDESVQLVDLAAQLGYFDQSHFINDFKSVLGRSPLAHIKNTSIP